MFLWTRRKFGCCAESWENRQWEDELNGKSVVVETKRWRPERNFRRARQKAEIAYLLSFDPEYLERQEIWQKVRFAGLVDLSHPWSSENPSADEN
jgi:hypothetical protein